MGRFTGIAMVLILLAVISAGCGGQRQKAGEEKTAERETTPLPVAAGYSARVAPIFAGKCNQCHHPDNAVEVDLTRPFHPQLGIINRPNTWTRSSKKILVVPGDPDASALIWKVEQTRLDPKVDGNPMPWNIDPLTDRERDNLRTWILQGAKNDTLYQRTVTRIFGDGASLGSRGGKCSYCHYSGAASGPDLTNPFAADRGSVNTASDLGGIRIVPGDPDSSVLFLKVGDGPLPRSLGRPMPLHFERLTAQELQVLRDWIAEGAQEN